MSHYNTYNYMTQRQMVGAAYQGLPTTNLQQQQQQMLSIQQQPQQQWKQPPVRPEILNSTMPYTPTTYETAAANQQYNYQYQLDSSNSMIPSQPQYIHWNQPQLPLPAPILSQQLHQQPIQQLQQPHIQPLPQHNQQQPRIVDNSLFDSTNTKEPHFLYCKKCALLKPAVEFASTTGFFNNNCKHCRNYRRKGEDAKSEAVQEIYRVGSYEQLKTTLAECIHTRRVRNAPLVCVHFYLDLNFVADRETKEVIDNPRFLTPEGRSTLANMLIKEVKTVDAYSYNHRSTRVFKSGETHKYLCSQSTALPWRQKKTKAALAAGVIAYGADADLHNCGGTILIKFQSPGETYQRVCVAYCHDVSHPPKVSKK